MKLIATADWHLSKTTPVSRTDPDYFETCIQKVRQIIELQNSKEAVLCIAGDIFDNLRVTPYMINVLMNTLKGQKVFTVAGQHDMEYRNVTDACAYTTLVQSRMVTHLNTNSTDLKGISFNEEIPRNLQAKVVLVHKTVTENDPPYFLKDAIRAKDLMCLLKDVPVIICGDYHVPFVKRTKNQVLINCGSLMRKGKDQIDYQPAVWYIDTRTLDVQRCPLKIKPAEEVFSFAVRNESPGQEVQATTADMDKVIERLTQEDMKPSFENILMALAVEENLSTEDMDILRDVLNTVRSGT